MNRRAMPMDELFVSVSVIKIDFEIEPPVIAISADLRSAYQTIRRPIRCNSIHHLLSLSLSLSAMRPNVALCDTVEHLSIGNNVRKSIFIVIHLHVTLTGPNRHLSLAIQGEHRFKGMCGRDRARACSMPSRCRWCSRTAWRIRYAGRSCRFKGTQYV